MPQSDKWSFFKLPLYQRLLLALVPWLVWLGLTSWQTLGDLPVYAYFYLVVVVCVIMPLITASSHFWLRAIVMIVAVPVCHHIGALAIEASATLFEDLGLYLYFPIGATLFTLLIGGALAIVAPLETTWRLWLLLLISGVMTGISIEYALEHECWIFVFGFNCTYTYSQTLMLSIPAAVWPVTFCLAVHYGCVRPNSTD